MENTKNSRIRKVTHEDSIDIMVVGGQTYTYTVPGGTDSVVAKLALFGVSNYVSNACALSRERIAELGSGVVAELESIVQDTIERCKNGTIATRTTTGKSITKTKLTDALKTSELPNDVLAILSKKLGLSL